MRGEHAVTIRRPADVVFALIADGSRNASWRPWVMEVRLHSGNGGEGSEWRQLVRGPGGKPADSDYVVTSCRPPHLYAYQVTSGPVRATAVYTLTEPDPGETTVSLVLTLSPRGALRLLTGFVLRQMVDELDSLERIGEVLSRPDGVSAQPPSS
ncbi:MAG TPA: SRPBCC family protein [Candidatus Dormibacteraeota bacterium]